MRFKPIGGRRPVWRGRNDSDYGLTAVRPWTSALEGAGSAAFHLALMASEPARARWIARHPDGAKVSLGCGNAVPEGWIGLDLGHVGPRIHVWDLRRPLPFADGTVSAFLLEHSLEHLYFDDARRLLEECHRCLRPGGAIRVVSPDAWHLAGILGRPRVDLSAEQVAEQVACDVEIHRWPASDEIDALAANRVSHQWGDHLSVHTREWVSGMLRNISFGDVVSVSPETSAFFDPVPSTHLSRFDGPSWEAFAVEARKSDGHVDDASAS